MALIENLIERGWLKTPRIIEAFRKIKREDFLPANLKHLAELNEALSIGHQQTISQPLVVAFMLELLGAQAGDRILDIGSGSGWTSALLAHIVSGGKLNEKLKIHPVKSAEGGISPEAKLFNRVKNEKLQGKIIAIEIIPELKEFGEMNVANYNFVKKGIAKFVCADGSKGWPVEAPYDKILASASLQENDVPMAWKKQLKTGGRLVCPIRNSVWLFIKRSENEFAGLEYPGFVFVPLTGNV